MKSATTILALASLTLGSLSAPASTSLTIVGESDTPQTIDIAGTILRAYNLGFGTNLNGSDPGQTTDQQGIPFKNISITGNHTTSPNTVNLSLYAGDAGGIQIITTTSGPHFGNANVAADDLYGSIIYVNQAQDQALEISGLDDTKSYLVQVMVGDDRGYGFDADVFLDDVDTEQNLTWDTGTGYYNLAKVEVSGQSTLKVDLQNAFAGIAGVVVSEIPASSDPEITSITLSGSPIDTATITFTGKADTTYTCKSSTDLLSFPTTETPINDTDLTADNDGNGSFDVATSGSEKFYRLEE